MVEATTIPGMADAARAEGERRAGAFWLVLARTAAVLTAAVSLTWVALVNGQPFFHPDTVAYVRGPDVAIMKLFGERFATPWAHLQSSAVVERNALAPSAAPKVASYNDDEVLGGRSIYYGFLTYLGELAGGFWLTVLVQGLAVALLVDITLRALKIDSLGAYGLVMAVIVLVTPAPFFVSLLLPDIWAGVAIGAVAALFALPGRLTWPDVAALAAMIAFGALAHNSIPLVLIAMMAVGGLLWVVRRRIAVDPRLGLAVCAGALAVAFTGGLAFNLMVQHSVGKPPLMPPFLTARVIQDGPGARFIRERCATQRFEVCRYAARLPMPADDFLWGMTPQNGVFETAGHDGRRALGEEQTRFALAAAAAYPLQQAQASLKNTLAQLGDTELSDFTYKPSVRASLSGDLPAEHLGQLRASRAYHEAWPLKMLQALQTGALLLALLAAAWMVAHPRQTLTVEQDEDQNAAILMALLIVAGVLANGAVCGILSSLYGRYQARVVWCLPLAALALAYVRPQSLRVIWRNRRWV
jgi:hypothetical protein